MAEKQSGQYELSEPIAVILARFNHDAFFWGAWWAWSHGLYGWGVVLSVVPALFILILAYGLVDGSAALVAIPVGLAGGLGLPWYFAGRANRVLWEKDRDRFYEVFAIRPEAKPITTRERVTVAVLFAPFVLVVLGGIAWSLIESFAGD